MGESEAHPSSRISVHQSLGGGSGPSPHLTLSPVADLLLWRKRRGPVLLLGSSTLLWFLFEKAGYSFLSFVANVQLLFVVILFLWAKSASLLDRPMPPLPNLEISEASALKVADALRVWLNRVLSVARDIAVGRNVKRLFQVSFVLWSLSLLGNFFNFLTLLYLGVILSLSIPVLYEKYQDNIDDKLSVTQRVLQTQCRRIDESILQKIARPMTKEKKMW
ncbi:PREDICTED: reticulon-like protein B10 isoform X2 [Tarenaya hassleriana]|uniref:reticulon-like protein B10 isoform X2 n=1 Tax=Tarenaya hassleriana TaxID=28532 RepID=UPI00053C521B|nr:PREDICTED: reticulon-like protein B10 isoform X2 [Tarenaya hassleriana]